MAHVNDLRCEMDLSHPDPDIDGFWSEWSDLSLQLLHSVNRHQEKVLAELSEALATEEIDAVVSEHGGIVERCRFGCGATCVSSLSTRLTDAVCSKMNATTRLLEEELERMQRGLHTHIEAFAWKFSRRTTLRSKKETSRMQGEIDRCRSAHAVEQRVVQAKQEASVEALRRRLGEVHARELAVVREERERTVGELKAELKRRDATQTRLGRLLIDTREELGRAEEEKKELVGGRRAVEQLMDKRCKWMKERLKEMDAHKKLIRQLSVQLDLRNSDVAAMKEEQDTMEARAMQLEEDLKAAREEVVTRDERIHLVELEALSTSNRLRQMELDLEAAGSTAEGHRRKEEEQGLELRRMRMLLEDTQHRYVIAIEAQEEAEASLVVPSREGANHSSKAVLKQQEEVQTFKQVISKSIGMDPATAQIYSLNYLATRIKKQLDAARKPPTALETAATQKGRTLPATNEPASSTSSSHNATDHDSLQSHRIPTTHSSIASSRRRNRKRCVRDVSSQTDMIPRILIGGDTEASTQTAPSTSTSHSSTTMGTSPERSRNLSAAFAVASREKYWMRRWQATRTELGSSQTQASDLTAALRRERALVKQLQQYRSRPQTAPPQGLHRSKRGVSGISFGRHAEQLVAARRQEREKREKRRASRSANHARVACAALDAGCATYA